MVSLQSSEVKLKLQKKWHIPFFRTGVHCVSQRIIWVILEGHPCCRVPLGVFLAEALLGVRSESELLTLSELNQQDV